MQLNTPDPVFSDLGPGVFSRIFQKEKHKKPHSVPINFIGAHKINKEILEISLLKTTFFIPTVLKSKRTHKQNRSP